jgi:hypothetical protein
MDQPALRLHLREQGRARIGCEDVKRGTLKAVSLNPSDGRFEDVFPVVIESEDEAAIHLNSVRVKDLDTRSIILGTRARFVGISDVVVL